MPPKKGTEPYDEWRNSDKYKIYEGSSEETRLNRKYKIFYDWRER